MTRQRIVWTWVSFVMAFTGIAVGWAQSPPAEVPARRSNQVGEFMRGKLPHVHQVVDALATEDFGSLAEHAQALEVLTLEESWAVSQTAEYRKYSEEFRRTCQELRLAGKNKDVNAATVAYIDMTLHCIKCHRHVRGQRLEESP